MANDEINDVGKATDKPKGFVKWSLLAYWAFILGQWGVIGTLIATINTNSNQHNAAIQKILNDAAADKEKLRVEYNDELKKHINRLERVEERADKVLSKQKEEKK